jgi:hypothetical protein
MEVKIFFWENYELKSKFRGFYFHRYATFPHTVHIQFKNKKWATRLSKKTKYIYFYL